MLILLGIADASYVYLQAVAYIAFDDHYFIFCDDQDAHGYA